MFHSAHIFIAGFTQRVGRSSNGVYRLFDQCYRRHASGDTLVEYFPWYIHPEHIAELTAERDRECVHETGCHLRIQIVGYSFGGQTAAHVCQALSERGVSVEHLTLCDPVARYGRLGWLRAANPWGVIRVPQSVLRVQWFYQDHPRWRLTPPFFFPASHQVRWLSSGLIDRTHIRMRQHADIDNSPLFREAVLKAARMIAGQGGCNVE